MVWINGSVLHDTPIKLYQCRHCSIDVTKYEDGSYDTIPFEGASTEQEASN